MTAWRRRRWGTGCWRRVTSAGSPKPSWSPPTSAGPLPEGVDPTTAATILQSYATGLFALEHRAHLAEGETLLVLGAGGGVGLAAVDLGRALGARVIGAASSEAKRDAALAAGAESVIDYTTEDLKARARELAGGTGVDVVYDPIGGDLAEPAIRALGDFGRYLIVGFVGGIPKVATNQVLLRNRSVVGVEWGGWAIFHPEENAALIERLLDLMGSGRLHPVAPTAYSLEEGPRVLADLVARNLTGKAVLVP